MNTELLHHKDESESAASVSPAVDRRDFITWAVAAPAAVAVGVKLATESTEVVAAAPDTKINSYLTVLGNNKLQLTIPRVESGQGIYTSSAILVAAELGINMEDITVVGMTTAQATEFTTTLVGGSGSTRLLTDPVRAAAAQLKARLQAVGATKILPGNMVETASGKKTFADLAPAAAATQLSAKPFASNWKYGGLLGKGMEISGNKATFTPGDVTPRIDSDELYTGTRKFTLDTNQDALNCLVMHSLDVRGAPKDVQIAKIKEMCPKVKAVIPFNSGKNAFTIYTGVGIVCDTMGEALDARDVIMKNNLITWNPGPARRFSSDTLNQKLRDAVGTPPPLAKILAAKQITGEIFVPFHNHGTLGTQAAVVETAGPAGGGATGATVWWASQCPKFNRQQVAQQIGLDLTPTKVEVKITPGYSHFGRNLLVDSTAEAARISDAIRKMGGLPNKNGQITHKVKVMWSRNDDMRLCPCRPPTFSKYIANIGPDGKSILSLNHKFVSILCEIPSGFDNTPTETLLTAANQTGFDYFPLATPSPYTFITNEQFREVVAPFPTGAMRAVYSTAAQGGKEMFIDEIARQTKQNRYGLRLKYIKAERIKTCLLEMQSTWEKLEAEVDAWNADATKSTFKGIGCAVHDEWNSASMQIVLSEISRTADIKTTPPQVKEVWACADMGKITNPSGAAQMMEGATADAVAMVYFSKIDFVEGASQQSTFLNYYWNRMRECNYKYHPARFVNVNDTRVGGAGELSAPSSFGAVGNAWAHLNSIMNPSLPSHYPQEFPLYPSPTAPAVDG